jgi:gamma-glutamylcyclotransferase (GGCT)/AIG2-like uncharacterized protein YtfP
VCRLTDLVFFYGTLMSAFRRSTAEPVAVALTPLGQGWIAAALFDLGAYPGAIPSSTSRVRGELHRMLDSAAALGTLDEFEGYRPGDDDGSLFVRRTTSVTRDDGSVEQAWVYFFNGPLGAAPRIDSGDYLKYLKVN